MQPLVVWRPRFLADFVWDVEMSDFLRPKNAKIKRLDEVAEVFATRVHSLLWKRRRRGLDGDNI